MSAEPVVLYVAGLGRSGSTLLDLMSGELEGACSCGELRRYWQAAAARPGEEGSDWICGCGEPVRGCPFWEEVGREARAASPIGPSEAFGYQRRFVRLRPRAVRGMASSRPDPAATAYARAVAVLTRAVGEVSGARVVVDSSKRPEEAYFLARRSELDLRVIHLVRDPRAVAHSSSRVKAMRQASTDTDFPRWHPAATAARWTARTAFVERVLGPALAEGLLPLRYEDLASRPQDSLERVAVFAGLGGTSGLFTAADEIELGPNHSLPGNPVRFRRGAVRIRADDAWRAEMPARARALVTALTLPFLRRHGYAVRTTRN